VQYLCENLTMAINSVSNGNVLLIDPMDAVSDLPQDLNGAPNYEEMFIFVSLRARRRRRSVIKFEAGSTSLVESQISDTNINMLGYDTESGNFSTKWTENETNSGTILEGFGVTNISIKTNSSYIPQVTIEFTDIRGLAFFNKGSSSPYQAIFDFPPPLFDLTVKGYYGKSLTYQLHLVRHSTQFDANTGNFVITAEFIARTFAPLTDVPFKYIDILPLIKQETQPPVDPKTQEKITSGDGTIDTQRQSPNVKLPPNSTHEFIIKLKNLYDGITTIKETSQESEDLDNAEQKLAGIDSNITLLNNFKNILEDEQLQKNAIIMVGQREQPSNGDEDVPRLRALTRVDQYNQIIQSLKTDGISESKVSISQTNNNEANSEGANSRLYLAVRIDNGEPLTQQNQVALDTNRKRVKTVLNKNFRSRLITEAKIDVNETKDLKREEDINHLVTRVDDEDIKPTFVALDITGYYSKLSDERESAKKSRNDARLLLTSKINNTVIEELGFKPTIRNVFKIICDDVDAFFNILRKANVDAENHHEKFKDLIFSNDSVKQNRVSAFPLYVSGNTGECNVERQVRQYPIKLSEQVAQNGGEPFPEITLVDNFIDAFIRLQKELLVQDLRSQDDEQGNNKWIPISPYDSELLNSVFGRRESPYKNLEFQYVGNVGNNSDKYLNKIIERYYVLSQYTFGRSFYTVEDSGWEKYITDDEFSNQEIIEVYATGEAYNLANSLTNQNIINNLKVLSDDINGTNIDRISQELQRAPAYNNVNIQTDEATSKYATIGNSLDPTITDEGERLYTGSDIFRLYKDRNIDNYVDGTDELYSGFEYFRGGAVIRKGATGNPENPIDKYISTVEDSLIRNILDFLNASERPVVFTKENIIYSADVESGDDYTTKYLSGFKGTRNSDTADKIPNGFEFADDIHETSFDNSLVDVLSDAISINNQFGELYDFFTGDSYTAVTNAATLKQAKAFLFSSNFLKARSFYHRFSKYKNKDKQLNNTFTYPSVVQVPYFTMLYMGGVVKYSDTGNTSFRQEVDALLDKFVLPSENENGDDRGFDSGERDVANFKLDVFYISRLMLGNDKNKFLKIFNDFVSYEYAGFERSYERMLRRVILNEELIAELDDIRERNPLNPINAFTDLYNVASESFSGAALNRLEVQFKEYLEEEMLSGSRDSIIETLFEPYIIVIPSEFTFHIPEFTAGGEPIFDSLETGLFEPLSTTNENVVKKRVNEIYFKKFFSTLSSELVNQKEIVDNIDSQARESIGDNDIKGTLYYSFKSISDKWIAGLGSDVNKGFPLNDGDSLIDKFVFVDRGMNPIGTDCVIDVQPLLNLVEDFDVNVFSVMSTLLSHNGFEFFPLQNFMSFKDSEWEDSFRTIETVDQDANPAFVCMYIGGAASQLNNDASEYEDDGIRDLTENGLKDFSGNCNDNPNVPEANNSKQPYSEVRAFRVRFAEQNQSFFTNIQLDGREFTETNDSLAILSKIAGDESNTSPIAKGQNLFSVYQNRAYSAKVKMLGNMMIQPTQYFQLENIPMYSGAYVILDVEHTITPNHAVTEFQGTKILKYPNPIMSEFAVNVGFQSGTAEDLSANISIDDVKSSPLYDEAASSGFLGALSTPTRTKSTIAKNNDLIQTLHPQVRTPFANLFKVWEEHGYYLQINSAFRSKQDQSNVTERDANGNPIARPGRSFHQYGLAVDLSLRRLDRNGNVTADIYDKDQNQYWDFPNGNPPNVVGSNIKATKSIAQIAEELGFRWGGRFENIDEVHFEKSLGYGYFNSDPSKKDIYDGTRPEYSQIGTIDDLIKKFDEGQRIGRYLIFDEEAKQYVKNSEDIYK